MLHKRPVLTVLALTVFTTLSSPTSYPGNVEELPMSLKALVLESRAKRAIDESNVLERNKITAKDLPLALQYIKKHPNYSSYHLLMAIRHYFPKAYPKISAEQRAMVLCSALSQTRFLNDWGNFSKDDAYDG